MSHVVKRPSAWLDDPSGIQRHVQHHCEAYLRDIEAIAGVGEPSFDNVAAALSTAGGRLFNATTPVTFLKLVSSDEGVRQAALEAEEAVAAAVLKGLGCEGVYTALRGVRAKAGAHEDAADRERLLELLLRDFDRSGMAVDAKQRKTFHDLHAKEQRLCLQFNKNIADVDTKVSFAVHDLEGLPEDFVRALPSNPDQDGHVLVSLKYPHLVPILQRAVQPETRKRLLTVYEQRCPENIDLLIEIAHVRLQRAKSLGFDTDAHFQCDIMLTNDPNDVLSYLDHMSSALEPYWRQDVQALTALKQQLVTASPTPTPDGDDSGGDGGIVLQAHDRSFLSRLRLEKDYSVDDEVLKPYFPLDHVLSGMLRVYEHIFGLTMVPVTDAATWHPDVKVFEVHDAATSAYIGSFALDLYPRPGTYSHAACFPIFVPNADVVKDSRTYPFVCVITNFSEPTDEKPALLRWSEVTTFFHEFGHAMHAVLCNSPYARFGWTWKCVEQDFLEVPSMALQNWIYEPEVLTTYLSRHWETGEPLPEHLRAKLVAAKSVGSGMSWRRCIGMAKWDMELAMHMLSPGTELNEARRVLQQRWDTINAAETGIATLPGTHSYSSWMHPTTGYNAGYASYLMSEVMAQDVFSIFKERGNVLDVELGMRFRRCILEPGARRKGSDMIQAFLGRPSNEFAFLKSLQE